MIKLHIDNHCRKLSQYDEINNLHVHVTNPSTIYIDTIGKLYILEVEVKSTLQ